jgi:hypothetical protein
VEGTQATSSRSVSPPAPQVATPSIAPLPSNASREEANAQRVTIRRAAVDNVRSLLAENTAMGATRKEAASFGARVGGSSAPSSSRGAMMDLRVVASDGVASVSARAGERGSPGASPLLSKEGGRELPREWADKMDQEPQVVFTSAVAGDATPAASFPSDGIGGTSSTPGRATRRADAALERRRVNAALRRAGLRLWRLTSEDRLTRFTCVGASEGRLMVEADRLGMEKRLRPECMTPPIRKPPSLLSRCQRLLEHKRVPVAAAGSSSDLRRASAVEFCCGVAGGARSSERPPAAVAGRTRPAVAAHSSAVQRASSGGCSASASASVSASASTSASASASVPAEATGPSADLAAQSSLGVSEELEAGRRAQQYEDEAAEAEAEALWQGNDGRGAYVDFSLDTYREFEPHWEGELFFSSLERQRLILSILSARPAVGGAGIDSSMLLAGKRWRVPLSPPEEEDEAKLEAAFFGWDSPIPPRELAAGGGYIDADRSGVAGGKRQEATSAYASLFCTHSSRTRFVLSSRWVTRFPPRILGRPPLDEIRDYFGEKVAFYFAFMHQ